MIYAHAISRIPKSDVVFQHLVSKLSKQYVGERKKCFCYAFRCLSINSTAARFSPMASKASALAISTKYETRSVAILPALCRKASVFILSSDFLITWSLNEVIRSSVCLVRSAKLRSKSGKRSLRIVGKTPVA